MNDRKRMGKDKNKVIFPVAPNRSEMSDTYLGFIEDIKEKIRSQRISVVLKANTSMICLYWNIGNAILQKQQEEGWSSNILDLQIKSKLMERKGKSVNNFDIAFPPIDSDMANNIFKDPYLFDFLGTDIPRREIDRKEDNLNGQSWRNAYLSD